VRRTFSHLLHIMWRTLLHMTHKVFSGVLLSTCFMLRLTQAQSTCGDLRGTTRDPSGLPLDHAAVTVHSIEQSNDRNLMSGDDGSFAVENLQPGHYELTATKDGFQKAAPIKVELLARQSLRIDITLTLAAQTETVEVSSAAEQVNTENGIIGDSKATTQITQLPLNFRAVTTSPLAALAISPNVQQDSQGNIALNGATANMTRVSVDGISTVHIFTSAAGRQHLSWQPI
jgi:hypothetical protein